MAVAEWATAWRVAARLAWRLLAWALQHGVVRRLARKRAHPLSWPPEQERAVDLMRTVYGTGSHTHWRLFIRAWYRDPQATRALQLQRVPGAELALPGARDSWLLSLRPELRPAQPRAACTLLFCHGGGFMAGEPLMGAAAHAAWMQALARAGVECCVLAAGYPLAPESPHPAPLVGAMAAYAWLTARERADRVIVGGDSVGGGLAVAALAALRDGAAGRLGAELLAACGSDDRVAAAAGRLLRARFEPPLALLLVSPAVDFTATGVFGRLAAQGLRVQDAFPNDYICNNDNADVAAALLPRHTGTAAAAGMAHPLVSPAKLASFAGLVRSRDACMLAIAGGAEAFAADVAAFVAHARACGLPSAALHEEPCQPHCWPMLPLPHLASRGARVVAPFVLQALGGCDGT